MNLGVAITTSARRDPGATAVFAGEQELSYAELEERANRLANVLIDHFGLERGDRVALLVHNRPAVVEVLGGCAKAGVTYCGLNFRLGDPEYDAIFENAGPRLLITEAEQRERGDRLGKQFGIPVIDVDDDDPGHYEGLLAAASTEVPPVVHEVRPADDFCIVYTSGTTGRPKGVRFDVNAVMQHGTVAALEYELSASSRWLMAIPHNSSLQITLVPLLLVGGAIGFSDTRGFDPVRFAAEVRQTRATHTFLVPTMLFRVLEAGLDRSSMPTLETIGYGSSPIPPDRVRDLVSAFGPIFIQLYGMAEIASIGTMLRKNDHARALAGESQLLSSAGRPSYAVDVRVVDDEGRDVAVGERGEVIFASAYVMKGYYRDDEQTRESLIDGWMHSGDIAELSADGFLYIVDRKKDLIIRGGFNILPSEIETVLYRHPAVLEAAVVGAPDAEWGEAVRGFVALKEGSAPTGEELTSWCRSEGLPSIKIPESIEIMESLPKNAVGKIAKRSLRDRSWVGARRV
ncbi:MAG TPA: AMP-binding protein [Solirubrobacteraceae bacterium]|nr:AMP-binding protein [Solirubrobacteraceae bacterium]